jgi:hypothetical protein
MPKGAKCRTARNAERREMPNGAKCRRALNPERREMPKGAESRTARNPERRRIPKSGDGDTPAHERLYGEVCPIGVTAVRDSALFGIRRSSEFGALRDSALFKIPRSSAALLPVYLNPNSDAFSLDYTLRD